MTIRRSFGFLLCWFTLTACSKDEKPSGTAASASASASAVSPVASSVPPPDTSAAPSASAVASAALTPRSDCPKGSAGPGTFEKPCEAKGTARMMDVKWTGKTDDKGPFFGVTNNSPAVILYGKIAVYFYDKAGKQLMVKDTAATPPKDVPYRLCSGNMFSGVMKVKEKATIQFSCVKKEHVPDGTTAIEAEMITVGFADSTEKKSEFYWTNPDLMPEQRKKGGGK